MDDDPFNLARFVEAQDPVMGRVWGELRAGRKDSHWMWFVFPQIAGLGASEMSRRYAVRGLDEARAYLGHPVLGERLRDCTQILLDGAQSDIGYVFGSPDDLKFHSSMTLFARAVAGASPFRAALARFFDGAEDAATVARVG
jgi:uncharacterized protein (DUF1810 family)